MAEASLHDEITEIVGSAREATWILEELADDPEAALALARRRRDGEPLQYLIGRWPFRSIELLVDARALIPRPETEQVVEVALDALAERSEGRGELVVVDLGTGSGAIGLSIASELARGGKAVALVLTDRSEPALELARQNAERLGISARLECGSWYEAVPPELVGKVDLLVSNPPYIDPSARAELAIELTHEPPGALFSAASQDGSLGMAEVAAVIEGAPLTLASGGVLVVEMGESQVEPALALAGRVGLVEASGFDDLAGHPRGIVAVAP